MDIIKKLMVHIDKADSQSKCREWSERSQKQGDSVNSQDYLRKMFSNIGKENQRFKV